MGKKIATIIKSSSHLEYVAQVVNPKEAVGVQSSEYALGKFMIIGEKTVGIIYDTELFNPNSLTLSAQKDELRIYAPDLQESVDVLLKVLLLGTLEKNYGNQNLPAETLEAGLGVCSMTNEEIQRFHSNEDGKIQVKYLVHLNNFGSKLNPGLFNCISSQLKKLFSPQQYKIIEIIERNLLWTNLCNSNS